MPQYAQRNPYKSKGGKGKGKGNQWTGFAKPTVGAWTRSTWSQRSTDECDASNDKALENRVCRLEDAVKELQLQVNLLGSQQHCHRGHDRQANVLLGRVRWEAW